MKVSLKEGIWFKAQTIGSLLFTQKGTQVRIEQCFLLCFPDFLSPLSVITQVLLCDALFRSVHKGRMETEADAVGNVNRNVNDI